MTNFDFGDPSSPGESKSFIFNNNTMISSFSKDSFRKNNEKRPCNKFCNFQRNKFCVLFLWIIIFGCLIAILYLSAEVAFYKNINKNVPQTRICMNDFNQTDELIKEATVWEAKGKEIIKEVLEKLHSEKWKLYKKSSILQYFTREDDGDLLKANGTIKIAPKLLKKVMFDDFEALTKWDPEVTNATILKHFGPRSRLNYYVSSKMGFSRDFLTFSYWEEYEDGYICVFKSVAWDEESEGDVVENGNIVRAYFKSTGTIFIPSEDGQTTFYTSIIDLDLKIDWLGWIPFKDMFFMLAAQNKFGFVIKRLKELKYL